METEAVEKFNNLRGKYFGINSFIPDVFIHKATGHLGVNVKWYNAPSRPDHIKEADYEYLYNEVNASFWNKQNEIAKVCGYDGSFQSGRSGGWAMPMNLSDTWYFVTPPESNGTDNMPIADAIEIEKFNMFAHYVKELFRLVRDNFGLIETLEDCRKLQEEIESL